MSKVALWLLLGGGTIIPNLVGTNERIETALEIIPL